MQTVTQKDVTARIRTLNDAFRKSFSGGRVMLTSGFNALDSEMKLKLLQAIQTFDSFDAGDDPHGEHDFVSVEVEGVKAFWKCDYYDTDIRYLSDDPSDEKCTVRVATIMLAEEY